MLCVRGEVTRRKIYTGFSAWITIILCTGIQTDHAYIEPAAAARQPTPSLPFVTGMVAFSRSFQKAQVALSHLTDSRTENTWQVGSLVCFWVVLLRIHSFGNRDLWTPPPLSCRCSKTTTHRPLLCEVGFLGRIAPVTQKYTRKEGDSELASPGVEVTIACATHTHSLSLFTYLGAGVAHPSLFQHRLARWLDLEPLLLLPIFLPLQLQDRHRKWEAAALMTGTQAKTLTLSRHSQRS